MPRRNSEDEEVPWWVATAIYLGLLLVYLIQYAVLNYFWPEYMLMSVDELSIPGASISDGLGSVWFIFAWGAVATLAIGVLMRDQPRDKSVARAFFEGTWISINAGVFEELIYRWLLFFSMMVYLPFMNWLSFGLVKWFYTEISIPIANWATLGALEPQLVDNPNWVFGAAIVSAGTMFSDGHKHSGFLARVNSWFIGMVMFYLVFNYGLGTAIVAHIVYDLFVFWASAATLTWRPLRQRHIDWSRVIGHNYRRR